MLLLITKYISQIEPSAQVRGERGGIVGKQARWGHLSLPEAWDWAIRSQKMNTRGAPNTKDGPVHLLAGCTTCKGFCIPAFLSLIEGISTIINYRILYLIQE